MLYRDLIRSIEAFRRSREPPSSPAMEVETATGVVTNAREAEEDEEARPDDGVPRLRGARGQVRVPVGRTEHDNR